MPETSQTPQSAGRAATPGTPGQRTPGAYPQGFTRIDNRIVSRYGPHIGALGIALYVVLAHHADNLTRTCYPSMETLSRYLQVSRPTIRRALRALEAVGLVRVARARSAQNARPVNVYTLQPLPVDEPACASAGNHVAQDGQAACPSDGNPVAYPGRDGKPALPPMGNHVAQDGKGAFPELDSINNTQLNQRASERGSECGQPAPAPPAHLDHLAVKAYQEVCGSPPDALQRAAIVATVTDVPRWTETIRQWLLAGYRKQNVAGMLDWYTHGIPERSNGYGRFAGGGRAGGGLGFSGQRSGNRAGEWHASSQTETPEERARFDAEWAALLQEARQRSQSNAA